MIRTTMPKDVKWACCMFPFVFWVVAAVMAFPFKLDGMTYWQALRASLPFTGACLLAASPLMIWFILVGIVTDHRVGWYQPSAHVPPDTPPANEDTYLQRRANVLDHLRKNYD